MNLRNTVEYRTPNTVARPDQDWRHIDELVEVVLLSMAEPTEIEQFELRCMWWRQRRQGYTLPVERGVIVIDGERET